MKRILISIKLIVLFAFYSCTSELGNSCDVGQGDIEKRIVELEALTKLDLNIPANLYIQEGSQFIEIEGPSDIIDKILSESVVGSERWIIQLKDCYDGPQISIWVSLPQFIALDISGSGDIVGLDTLRTVTSLNLEIDGSGDMDLQLQDADKIDVEIKGSGNINIHSNAVSEHSYQIDGSGDIASVFNKGQTSRMQIKGSGDIEVTGKVIDNFIDIDGAGSIKAHELCTENCVIKTKGSGECEVKVSNTLNVKIDGSGDVCYKGQPTIEMDISGSGKVVNCD